MKTFCILEQGNTINHPLTLKKKRLFTTKFSDFYRLNWKAEADPNAFLKIKNITWSEGRSLLYENVPKKYEYYILTDEDVSFHAEKDGDIVLKLKHFFDEYKPLTGILLDRAAWNFDYRRLEIYKHFYYRFIKDVILKNKIVHPICCHDAPLQFFSKSFADIIFPVPFHGMCRSTQYSNWICYKLFPLKQMCFRGVSIINNLHEEHESIPRSIDLTYHCKSIMKMFNEDTYDKSFTHKGEWFIPNLMKLNYRIALRKVDKKPIHFTLNDLRKIYDIHNTKFLNRKSRIETAKPEYNKR